MRKALIIISTVVLFAAFLAGCAPNENSIPQNLKVGAINSLGTYTPSEIKAEPVSNNVIISTTEEKENKYPFSVPKNYKNIHDYVFAVIDKDKRIVEYRIAVKSNGKWKWEKCDASGIIPTTTEKKESTTREEPTTHQTTTKPNRNNKAEGTTERRHKPTQTTTHPTTVKKKPTTTKPPVVTTTQPTTAAFKWERVSFSNIPSSIRNQFEAAKTQTSNVQVTQGYNENVNAYIMITAPVGKGIDVVKVEKNGKITYELKNSGSGYVIVRTNRILKYTAHRQ